MTSDGAQNPSSGCLPGQEGAQGSCRAAPEQSLSLAAAQVLQLLRYRVQGGDTKRLQSRCRYWMDAGERKGTVGRKDGRPAGLVGLVGWLEVGEATEKKKEKENVTVTYTSSLSNP